MKGFDDVGAVSYAMSHSDFRSDHRIMFKDSSLKNHAITDFDSPLGVEHGPAYIETHVSCLYSSLTDAFAGRT